MGGTRITFPKEGEEVPNRAPGDVVFVGRSPHLAKAGAFLEVATILGEPLHLSTKGKVISPDSTHRFPGQGLTHQINGSSRGDLIVDFSIEFPKTMSQKARSSL
ncbi:dnaJ protein homolog 1-like [Drosophila subpulchrella]|uniref:dnaJ protein homolog 1-like n=1 Tax=Drosophila subpulchrella TaxID=1486046 RepID=UPI0018A1A01C|nr:dnaJ protein homolog 1-like [Drosophila subpulchrella]